MAKHSKPRSDVRAIPKNTALREAAHTELDYLLNIAENGQQYGSVTVKVGVAAGEIDRIQGIVDRSTIPAR